MRRIEIDIAKPNTGLMDFSDNVDAPAGKYGFVKVRNGHFFFENGKQIRFFGFNFPARANFPAHETADLIADRLVTLGVNAVRIHAADAFIGARGWSTDPEFSLLRYPESSREFNEKGRERLDYWMAALIRRGIYLHIDLLVGRNFLPEDGLDYPYPLRSCKLLSHMNRRLIELQKEYAAEYLLHVNPYTGRSLADEPGVMGIQICNEDSAFFDVKAYRSSEACQAYQAERQQRFNEYLREKYAGRDALQEAWSFEGISELQPEEDPWNSSVVCPEPGDYCQDVNEPLGAWENPFGPARYADFSSFCMKMNRDYYHGMREFILSLGVKVPVVNSCLLTGAADIASHLEEDFCENNTYFNHPVFRPGHREDRNRYYVPNLREYVSTDPLTETYPGMEPRSNLITQAGAARVEGKPFVVSEWNEYGAHPFHSTAYMMNAAYACLNDWDGLFLYCYHESDMLHEYEPGELSDLFECYDDPALIGQFGILSDVFLHGRITPSQKRALVRYHENDLLTLPEGHRMPYTVLPFLMSVQSAFPGSGEGTDSTAPDVELGAGFFERPEAPEAAHSVTYFRSPYETAFRRRYYGKEALLPAVRKAERLQEGIWLTERRLIFSDINALTENHDYRVFASALSRAMESWGILPEGTGYSEENGFCSDTGEIRFSPNQSFFEVSAPSVYFYSGKPRNEFGTRRICFRLQNERITCAMLARDGKTLEQSEHILIALIGKTGAEEQSAERGEGNEWIVRFHGKIAAEAPEGRIMVRKESTARITALDQYGEKIRELISEEEGGSRSYRTEDFFHFELTAGKE